MGGLIGSRRSFLKQLGAAALTVRIGLGAEKTALSAPRRARSFRLAPVYDRPDGDLIGHLAPDGVHPVSVAGGWYRLDAGWVPLSEMQPLAEIQGVPISVVCPPIPFWAEVSAPSSSVRVWAGDQAPIGWVAGQGAVIRVVGSLSDDSGQLWCETTQSEWLRAVHLSALEPALIPVRSIQILVQIDPVRLLFRTRQSCPIQTAYAGGADLKGLTRLRTVQPGGERGRAWLMETEAGTAVYGVHWHNRFGLPSDERDLQLPISAARLIYQMGL